ncbi:Ig-like domain-containing protein, partial [Chloroflexota bacterium]
MKKLISVLLALLLVVMVAGGGVLPQVASAAVDRTPSVQVSLNAPAEVLQGSNFAATIGIGEVIDLNGAQYDILFDPSVLRLDDINTGQIDSTEMPVQGFTEVSPGRYRVLQSLMFDTVNGTGYLAVLHFHVVGSLGDTSTIDLSNGTLSGWEAEIPATWVGDSVNVSVQVSLKAPAEVLQGSNFTATVDISEVIDLNGAQYDILFDPSVLTVDNVTAGQIDSTEMPVLGFAEVSPGRYRVLQSLMFDTINGTGYLAVLHFHVVGSQGDNSTIDLSNGILSGWEAEMPATWVGDTVNVVEVDTTPPTVIATSPTANATGVAIYKTTIQVTFSESMNTTSVESAFSILPTVSGGFSWTDNVLTFIPGGNLTYNTTYTVTINTAAQDLAGNPLAEDYIWSFTTMVPPPELVSIAVTPEAPSITQGQTQQFTANGTYTDASTADITNTVTWASSNPDVATIDTAGLATSVSVGTTVITASLDGITSPGVTLTVTPRVPVSITVTPEASSIGLGRTQQFAAEGTYEDESTADITSMVSWASDTPSVATIRTTGEANPGLATALGLGTTVITASLAGTTSPGVILTVLTTVEVNLGERIIISQGGSQSDIPLDIKGFPDLGPDNGLGAFGFILNWDPAVINVTSVTPATAPPGYIFVEGVIDNDVGECLYGGFAYSDFISGDLTVAYLAITAVGNAGDTTSIDVTIDELTDVPINPIPALPIFTPVMIVNLIAETSISEALDQATGKVVVVDVNIDCFKDPSTGLTANITGGIGSYSATVSAAPGSGIEVLGVNGMSPSDNLTFNNVTGIFSVAAVSSPCQADNTTVAELVLRLSGNATTPYDLTV